MNKYTASIKHCFELANVDVNAHAKYTYWAYDAGKVILCSSYGEMMNYDLYQSFQSEQDIQEFNLQRAKDLDKVATIYKKLSFEKCGLSEKEFEFCCSHVDNFIGQMAHNTGGINNSLETKITNYINSVNFYVNNVK